MSHTQNLSNFTVMDFTEYLVASKFVSIHLQFSVAGLGPFVSRGALTQVLKESAALILLATLFMFIRKANVSLLHI